MLKRIFSLKGRIGQSEYIFSFLVYVLFCYLLSNIGYLFNGNFGVIIVLDGFGIAVWFLVAQGVKRSHDIGNSGWYTLVPLYLVFLLFKKSSPGNNAYGSNPYGG